MKKLLVVALFFYIIVLPKAIFSQQTEGCVKYLTTFNWVKMLNACDYLSKQRKDKVSYMYGNRSTWQNYSLLFFSAKQSKFEDSEEKAKDDDGIYSERKEVFFMTRNFENNTYFDAIEMLGKVNLVQDTLHPPEWKILNDMKEVAEHVCMNATWTDTLRGQNVVVWFALDIPVQAGPDRFFGLPGLILEVNINNGAKVMTAEKFEMKTITDEFKLPKKTKGKQMNEKAYLGMIKKFLDDKRKMEEFPWGIRY
ncbi:MAG: GLPGLI family protein [Bacteroidota bacterium]